jgi:CreA protein
VSPLLFEFGRRLAVASRRLARADSFENNYRRFGAKSGMRFAPQHDTCCKGCQDAALAINRRRDIAMKSAFALLTLAVATLGARAETVGDVSTTFRWVGANNKIVVDVFDDPKVTGVSCYLSHAKTGGVKGSLGIAEDTSDASVACRQVGPIAFNGTFSREEEVFSERSSFLFKHVRVVRMADRKRNTLVYLVYSDRVIEGSPKNSVTAVPVPADQPLPVK